MAEAMAAIRGRIPLLAAGLALLVLFAAMPAWRYGDAPEFPRYAISAEAFEAKVDAMIRDRTTGAEEDGVPVVHPPPGDVYLLARRWQFYPVLELEAGRSYRLHVASVDVLHGFHLGDIDLLLVPGAAAVVPLTPDGSDRVVIQCSEFCGLRHNRMTAWVRIVPPSAEPDQHQGAPSRAR